MGVCLWQSGETNDSVLLPFLLFPSLSASASARAHKFDYA